MKCRLIIISDILQNNQFKQRMSAKFDEDLSYATHKKHTIKFKVVFVGDQAVGKSSIINRFIKNQFDATHNPTVGIDFVSKNMTVGEKAVRLQLWDTAGQERFKSLIPGYLRDSHGIILVYDVTNRESFDNLSGWIDYVKEHRGDDVTTFVIGNKTDLEEERVVTQEEVKQKLKLPDNLFVEVSAKTGDNLETLFKDVCDQLLKSNELETTTTNINNHSRQKYENKKKNQNFQKEKEKPLKKQKEEPIQKNEVKEEKGMHGSKLVKGKQKNGKIVREKNCC